MFTTINEVKTLTDYDVEQKVIAMAQALVEAYVGRDESEIVDADDMSLLAKATAYQAAYMSNNWERTFEQMAVAQVAQFGQAISFKQGDSVSPFISPLTVMACQRLSWKRQRSVKTGSIFSRPPAPSSWRTR